MLYVTKTETGIRFATLLPPSSKNDITSQLHHLSCRPNSDKICRPMPNRMLITTAKIETGSIIPHCGHLFWKSGYWYHGCGLR